MNKTKAKTSLRVVNNVIENYNNPSIRNRYNLKQNDLIITFKQPHKFNTEEVRPTITYLLKEVLDKYTKNK